MFRCRQAPWLHLGVKGIQLPRRAKAVAKKAGARTGLGPPLETGVSVRKGLGAGPWHGLGGTAVLGWGHRPHPAGPQAIAVGRIKTWNAHVSVRTRLEQRVGVVWPERRGFGNQTKGFVSFSKPLTLAKEPLAFCCSQDLLVGPLCKRHGASNTEIHGRSP